MQRRLVLTILLIAQLGDALTFTIGEAMYGIGLESNGIVRFTYDRAGLAGVLLLKGATIIVTLIVLAVSARRLPRLFVWVAAAGTAIGVIGVVTNVWSLVLLTG